MTLKTGASMTPKQALSLLFSAGDFVASPDIPLLFASRTHESSSGVLESTGAPPLTELFAINPLDGLRDHKPEKPWHSPTKPRRADYNVTEFRNFIFESDSVPIDAQLASIERIKHLVRLAVHSGNKSVSLIISVADRLPFTPHTEEGIVDYKLAWSALKAHLEALTSIKYDPSTKNPSRLTRTPNVVRVSTGQLQHVVHTGPLVTSDFVMSLLQSTGRPQGAKAIYVPMKINSLKEFERVLRDEQVLRGLRTKLQDSHKWAASQNMYPELIKLTFWAIDATGVSFDVLLEYMRLYTFPALLEVGYPKEKIEMGVLNGYRHKGLMK